ncbi:hypothetical protein AX17_002446 [Amanita inopinata Kibby_2008]|nr:hypothetical protein AX17_002446 [Amanita inopinata Kibby_2008]
MSARNTPFNALSPITYIHMVAFAGLVVSLCGGVEFWKDGKRRKRRELEMQELSRKAAEISELQKSLNQTRANLQAREDAISVLKNQTERLNAGTLETQKQLRDSRSENESLREQIKAQERDARTMKQELDATKEKQAQAQELLNARTSELKAAQAFLTTADKLSNFDVIKLVEALNAEILQTAALVADAFTFETKGGKETVQSDDMEEAIARATETVGPRMVRLLMLSEHSEDPILVQIAIQGGLCAYAQWIIASWYFEGPDNERLLRDVYHYIRDSEEQAIYGRWRALTRKHVQRMIGDDLDLTVYFMDAFASVLITAGVKDSQAHIQEVIQSRFSVEINGIVKKSQELNKVLGEDVTSCELEILYVEPDDDFDESFMEDTFDDQNTDSKVQNPECVLCTTDLGLNRHKKTSGEPGWKVSVLLKPKIVLQSKLDAIVTGDDEN